MVVQNAACSSDAHADGHVGIVVQKGFVTDFLRRCLHSWSQGWSKADPEPPACWLEKTTYRCASDDPPVHPVCPLGRLTVKGPVEIGGIVSERSRSEVSRLGVQGALPLRRRALWACKVCRGLRAHAPTASWSRALSSSSSGGALAAAFSSPLTTRIVAGAITTVRTFMGSPQRGQETRSSWNTRHRSAAHVIQAGWGASAGSLVSRMRHQRLSHRLRPPYPTRGTSSYSQGSRCRCSRSSS